MLKSSWNSVRLLWAVSPVRRRCVEIMAVHPKASSKLNHDNETQTCSACRSDSCSRGRPILPLDELLRVRYRSIAGAAVRVSKLTTTSAEPWAITSWVARGIASISFGLDIYKP